MASPKEREKKNNDDLDEIEYQKNIQDEYTKNLVQYAALMKKNAMETESFLINDKQKLEKMGESVNRNYDLSSSTNKEVHGLLNITSSNLWTDIFIICSVILGFVVMYFFMKIVGKPA